MNTNDLQNIIYNSIKKITDSELSKLSIPKIITARITKIGEYRNYYKINYQNYEHIAFCINGNISLSLGDRVYVLFSHDNTFDNLILGRYYESVVGFESGGSSGGGGGVSSNIVDLILPVGSVITNSKQDFDPNIVYPGTVWQRIKGKVIVGVDESDTDFATANKTGGEKKHTLTTAELASHTHTQAAHTHSVGAHAHGLNSHVHSVGAHAHGLNSHTHDLASHTHSVGAHAHGLNSHTHAVKGSTGAGSSHTHNSNVNTWVNASGGTGGWVTKTSGYYATTVEDKGTYNVAPEAAHTHQMEFTSGAASGNTANSTAFNSGGPSSNTSGAASGNTANSTAFNTGAASGSTENSTAFNAGSTTATNNATGSDTAHNNLQPYITKYVWERIA